MLRKVSILAALAAVWLMVLPGSAHAAGVDYKLTAACAYSASSNGWASVGRAPRGTIQVVYTMRTGQPPDPNTGAGWSAVDITATSKARKWRIVTDPGMSFINWVKFYDASDNLLFEQNVNVRCAGTPSNWPA